MSKKKIFFPLIVIVLGALIAVGIVKSRPDAERRSADSPDPVVRVVEAQPTEVTLRVSSQGTVRPRTESHLVAQVSGEIVQVGRSFAQGGLFERGDLLARIDPSDYELRVSAAEAQLAQAQLRLEQEAAQAAVAREEWSDLGNGDASPLALREPQMAEARAAMRGAESSLEQAKLNLRRTEIRAPFAGRVREKRADLGQFVRDGTQIASLFSIDIAEVHLPIPQDQLAFLNVRLDGKNLSDGPPVLLSANLGGEPSQWQGRIVRTAGELDSRSRMFTLIAQVDDPYRLTGDGPVLPVGLFVDAEIEGRIVEDVFPIPRTALREGSRVLVLDNDSRLRFRAVELLRLQGEMALVADGLAAGELVCVSQLDVVIDGMRVDPLREDTSLEMEAAP